MKSPKRIRHACLFLAFALALGPALLPAQSLEERARALFKNLASIFWFRLMQFHGTRLGYRESSLLTPQLRETFYYARQIKPGEGGTGDVGPIRYREK